MSEGRFRVVEVKIAKPHERRVMAEDMSEADAEAFIKFAVIRRGVEEQFYVAECVNAALTTNSEAKP